MAETLPEAQDKIIYFVRHGQSVDNVTPVFQSALSPLSESGRSQAEDVAQRLATLPFEALIASPLPRAKQTAKAVALKTGHEIEYSDLFVERIKPVEIDGKPFTDKQANKTWRDWNASMYTADTQIGEGENYEKIIKRADDAFAYLAARPESRIAVITHGYFLRTMVARLIAGEAMTTDFMQRFQERADIENTGITVLKYSAEYEQNRMWRLWTFNDHAHFAE